MAANPESSFIPGPAETSLFSPIVLAGLGVSVALHLMLIFLVVLPKTERVTVVEEVFQDIQIQRIPKTTPKPPKPKIKPPEPKKAVQRSGSSARKIFQSTAGNPNTGVVKTNNTKFDGNNASGQGVGNGSAEGTGSSPVGDPKGTGTVAETAPPPPPPPPAELIKARPLSSLVVVYPEAAKSSGVEGVVVVRAFIDENGEVTDVKVKRSSGNEDLDNAAKEAVLKMRFEPARRGNDKEPSKVDVPVRFSLS
jgi:TonB family protein